MGMAHAVQMLVGVATAMLTANALPVLTTPQVNPVLLSMTGHYVNDPVLRGSAIPDFEALVVLFRMVEVYSEVINAHLHVIRAL